MKLFVEQGAVKALMIDEKNVRFDIDTSRHAHFMCLECGCVYDLPIENQEAIQLEGVGGAGCYRDPSLLQRLL